MLHEKHAILAACQRAPAGSEPKWAMLQQDYQRITASMTTEAKAELVQWMSDASVEVVVPIEKRALYHAAPGRLYRPTRRERDSGKFECPACHVFLVVVTRKAKDRLYRCPSCMWGIARSDIFEPEQGEEPELRPGIEYGEGVIPGSGEGVIDWEEGAEKPW